MPTIPRELPAEVRHGLARLGLDNAAVALAGAGDDFVESEVAFREAGRLEAIGADRGRVKVAKEREERFNAAGRRQLERALAEFEQGPAKLDADIRRQLRDAIASPDFRDRLRDAHAQFQDDIVGAAISGAEAAEVVAIRDEAQKVLEQEGFDALVARGRDMVKEAREARGQPHKGREPHSPLSMWKYVTIAAAFCFELIAVIACFVWSRCSWLIQAIGFWNSWIFPLIGSGCAPIPADA